MRDDDIRSACFAALDVLQAKWGADVPYAALAEGFNFRGRKVPFLNRSGPARSPIRTLQQRCLSAPLLVQLVRRFGRERSP